MEYVRYGSTGPVVSRLCIGTGHFARAYPDPEGGGRFLLAALDRGVTFWDTAESYGSHPHVGAALRQIDRSRVVIQTKTTCKSRAEAAARIDAALREMGTDYLDVILLHAVNSPRDFRERAGALEAMLAAKAAGKVRCVGCSTHVYTGPAMDVVTEAAEIEVILCTLNKGGTRLEGSIVDPDPDAPREPAVPSLEAHIAQVRRAYERGKGISLMKVIGGGSTPEAERAEWIRWAFAFPYAHAVNLGMTYPPELELDVRLEAEVRRERAREAA